MSVSATNWSDLPLSHELFELIEKAGFVIPSPVQAQTIPLILEGHDVLVSSQTGSGKTASFVLPVVEKFKNKNGTYILALAPTREIAQQTGAVFEQFAAPFGMKVAVCIGGASIPVEKEALAASPHIIVATPGRLCDHLERGHVWLDFIQCLIFDEADRMLDMGFAKQMEAITDHIPKERQTLMFSATFAPPVEKLARRVMKEPKQVTIEKAEGSVPKIDQRLFWVEENRKHGALLRLIREEPGTMIIFVKAKERTFQVWRVLEDKKIPATYIHSDLPQEARELAIADFKAGKYQVLVATDVMGRGIDIDDVAHVLNYDVPREAEDYIHRIGRTGRAGREGRASTFAVPGKDDRAIRAIEKLRGIESTNRPDQEMSTEAERPRYDRSDRNDRSDRRPRGDSNRGRGPRPEGQSSEVRADGSTEPRPRHDRGPRRPRGPRPEGEQRARPAGPEQTPRVQREPQPRVNKPQTAPAQSAPTSEQRPTKGVLGWIKKIFK
jgi:superfamily II DNA/RNA helicase